MRRPAKTRLFETAYGHFAADGREYVVTRPDTPKPWSNVICPDRYGTIVTQAGTGYSWMTHATLNRLTRWEQDLVRDPWGKFLYCRDRKSGKAWSLAHQPVRAKARRYQCRHGIGYTTFESEHHGIRSTFTVFVPPGESLEVWRVTLENPGRASRTLDLFSYFEWNLGPAPDTHREFHKLFIEQRWVPGARALVATKRLNTIAEHGVGEPWNCDWPHAAFHAVSVTPAGWETDKASFFGRHGTLAAPAALARRALSNTTGKFADGIASLQAPVVLRPGQSREILFTLGIAETPAAAARAAKRFASAATVEKAWVAMRRHWESYLAPIEVETPDPAFDVLTNTWLKYQSMSCRIWGRTGYFQPGGAYGFRDQLQDSQVFLPIRPEKTLEQILLHAAHQFEDGTTWHWWHPLTEEGLRKPYNDDLLWLPFVMLNYLRETADFAALEREAPFLGEDGRRSLVRGTLYEHCRRAIDSFWTRIGPHGVPLMGAGDWNDGLSAIGRKLQSESVWLGHFLVGVLEGWAEMERRREGGDAAVAMRYADEAAKMRAAINRNFWDGAWYARATKDSGEPIGVRANREGRIFLNAQTWAVLHGVAPPERVPVLLRSMERHLYQRYGPLLLAPAYARPDSEIGYLTRYAPGARENGGLYTHAGAWAVQAECMLGRRRKAWALLKRFWPVYRGMEPDLYECEPYVSPGNVDGPVSPKFGRGGWTWYTGSAAWMFRIATEWLIGVRPTYDGLLIDPCLPPEWDHAAIRRAFRGAVFDIAFEVARGPMVVMVDGVVLESNLVPPAKAGSRHSVAVRVPPA